MEPYQPNQVYAEDAILEDILATHETPKERWTITDDHSADWAVSVMQTAQKHIDTAYERKRQLIHKIDKWFENATRGESRTIERMEQQLTDYVKENGKRKLIGGTIYLQKSPDKIIDDNADVEGLYVVHPDLIRIKKELDKNAAKKMLQSDTAALSAFNIYLKEGEPALRIKR